MYAPAGPARRVPKEDVRAQVTFAGRRGCGTPTYDHGAAGLFATTRRYEPSRMAPLEAMACGAPAVGPCVGGITSTARDGETGCPVPPNDPAALAERIAHLSRSPERS